MAKTGDIFNEQGCLSQFAIESCIRGDITQSEDLRIQEHIKECPLCNSALRGASQFENITEYTNAVHDLKTRWNIKNSESVRSKQVKLTLALSIAASLLVLISIITFVRYQKDVRYKVLSQITEEGTSIDEVLSGSQITYLSASGSKIHVPDSEDSARNEFFMSGHSHESVLPIARIEETVIYSEKVKFESDTIITARPEQPESKIPRLRSPFSIMSHPPAARHYDIPDEVSDEADIFIAVEDMPGFQNGRYHSFRKYVFSNIRYPREALREGVSGRVYVQFTINKKGELTDATIIRSDNSLFDDEVLRVVMQSPKWTPGKQRGRPVDVSLIMPVDFVMKKKVQ